MKSAFFTDLAAEVEIPCESTISNTLYQDEHIKVVLFGFAAGQELSEPTASVPAPLQFIDGEADVLVGEERPIAKVASAWSRYATVFSN